MKEMLVLARVILLGFILTDNSNDKLNMNKIERMLNTSSTSSIYETLNKIQQSSEDQVDESQISDSKLDISLSGLSKHKSLTEITLQEPDTLENIKETLDDSETEQILAPSMVQEYKERPSDLTMPDQCQVSIICPRELISSSHKDTKDIKMSIGGNPINFSLKTIVTDGDLADETVKKSINGSKAGIIVLPPTVDINDIQTVINRHVAELWSLNGLGPIPFVITTLEDKARSITVDELLKPIEEFIENLTPITRGNYGFGVKSVVIESLEAENELRKVLRNLAILLISYNRFKIQKTSRTRT